MSGDSYIDLETGILRNRLGITDATELAQAESELTSYRLIELRRTSLPGRYDLAHLQAFHRYIFGDLYDWAGELRSVSIGKGDLFYLPQHLGSFAEDVFGKLAQTGHLRGLERAVFADGLTALLADINALHPFREGNGRTQRAFLAQLARDAGHPIHWAGMDPTVNVAASQAAHRGNNEPLRAMLDELVDDDVDTRDVPDERAPAPEAPTVVRAFGAPAPRIPGDNEPRHRPNRGTTSA
ncbi:MAG: Fic/DOC family protein [Pseudonocardiaceae bacterium]